MLETENNPNFPMAIFFIGFKSHRELERRVKKHLEELELQLTQEWNNIELSVLEKRVDSDV